MRGMKKPRPFLRTVSVHYQPKNSFFVSSALKAFIKDERNEAFILKLPQGLAHVTYKKLNGVTELTRTYVPEIFRGKGVAAALAKEVLDYCMRNRIKVKLSCWYLERFYKAHASKYKSIVT